MQKTKHCLKRQLLTQENQQCMRKEVHHNKILWLVVNSIYIALVL